MALCPARRAATTAVSIIMLRSFCCKSILRPFVCELDIIVLLIYCNVMKQVCQQINNRKIFAGVSGLGRLIAGVIALCVFGFFLVLWLDSAGRLEVSDWLNPCGFKQRYDLPCPSCGMTKSAKAFSQGRIVRSFSIQPAGAILCILLAFSGFLSFIAAVFGVYFCVLKRFYSKVKVRYIVLAFLILIAVGWAVNLLVSGIWYLVG